MNETLFHDIVPATNQHDGKFRLNESYRPIAEALVAKFPELEHVPVNNLIFIENSETAPKRKGKYILAQIGTVPGKWSEIIEQLTGARVWYWMEIFKKHIKGLSREQIVALIYHELRHISKFGGTIGHDIEDWSIMVDALGSRWNHAGTEIPDLLGEDVNWSTITARKLIEDPADEAADGEAATDEEGDVAADSSGDTVITITAAGQSVTTSLDGMRRAADRLGYRSVPAVGREANS